MIVADNTHSHFHQWRPHIWEVPLLPEPTLPHQENKRILVFTCSLSLRRGDLPADQGCHWALRFLRPPSQGRGRLGCSLSREEQGCLDRILLCAAYIKLIQYNFKCIVCNHVPRDNVVVMPKVIKQKDSMDSFLQQQMFLCIFCCLCRVSDPVIGGSIKMKRQQAMQKTISKIR